MLAVPDAAAPVTTPPASTLAIVALLLLQLPPGVASDNVIVEPLLTLLAPEIAATVTSALTVTTAVVLHVLVPVYVTVAVPGDTP